MSEQMKNKRDLSDTMDVNVELARKAVGSLFFNDDGDPEDILNEDAAQQRERWSEIKKHRAEKHKVENDKPVFANTSPLPIPKPAVKVNPSIPAVSRVPIRSERSPIAEESDMPKEALFLEDDDTNNNYAADEAGNDEGEFADFRQRLELARKAVDSLFLNEDVSGNGAEKRLADKHSAQEYKDDKHKDEVSNEIPKDKKTENSEAITKDAAYKASSSTQNLKSESKVDKSIPQASRVPPRPERRPAAEEEPPKDVRPNKDRTPQSRYVFVDENEKGSEIQKSVKPAKARPQSRFVFIDEEGAEEVTKNIQPPKDHTAKNRHTFAEKEDADDQTADIYQKYRDIDKKAAAKVSRPKPKPFPAEYASTRVTSGLSTFMRGIITAFAVMLLLMMAFLIHRTTVLSERLTEANEELLTIPALEHDLNNVRIELEGAGEALAAAEAEIARLTSLGASSDLADDLPAEGEGYENGVDDHVDDSAGAPAPAAPSAPPAARTHTVVRGDSLSRISNQFYGSSAPSYIQRIMDANNITDPNRIAVGDQLIIP